jgi:hypothetical protein
LVKRRIKDQSPINAALIFVSNFIAKGVRMPAKPSLESQLTYRIPRIKLALVKEKSSPGPRFAIRTPTDVARFLEPLKRASEEHFVSVHLN